MGLSSKEQNSFDFQPFLRPEDFSANFDFFRKKENFSPETETVKFSIFITIKKFFERGRARAQRQTSFDNFFVLRLFLRLVTIEAQIEDEKRKPTSQFGRSSLLLQSYKKYFLNMLFPLKIRTVKAFQD